MPTPAPDVVFALLGDVTASSRALRQIRALVGAGARVTALSVGAPRDPGALPPEATLRLVDVPAARGPAYFLAAHRAMRVAATPAGLYHASDLHVLPAMGAAAAATRGALSYDAREYYPGLDAAGRPWVRWAWGAVERRWIGRADRVLTVCEAIADTLASRYRITRPAVVRNVSDAPAAGLPRTGALRKRLGLDDRPLVLYQGLWREGRGLRVLVRAMRAAPEAALVLIGEGPLAAELKAMAAGSGGQVHLLPFVPPEELKRLTPDADVGAIPIRPLTESLRMALPNKVFEYAAAGVPVLAGSGIEPLAEIVRRYGAGLAADPDSPTALAAAIRSVLAPEAHARYREGACRLHRENTWEAEREVFLGALGALLAGRA